jgi:hypothetical protein
VREVAATLRISKTEAGRLRLRALDGGLLTDRHGGDRVRRNGHDPAAEITIYPHRRERSKPMLHILQLPMPKETLAKMTPEERSLFLLWKVVIIATNHTPENPIEQRVSGAQTQIFVRLTIGAMWEAWLLVERGFLKAKIGRDYVPLLDTPAQEALDRLKQFFASNRLAVIRNNFAYHHPTNEQMEAAFQMAVSNKNGEEADWSIFFNQALLNTFFFVSDYVLVHGITDALKETDVNGAHQKLLGDLAPVANDLSEFTFGFAKAIFQKYIHRDELVMNLVAKVADAPNIADVLLPHYLETPGLRNT